MARAQLAARYWRALSFNIIVTSFLTSFLLPYATTMASGVGDDGAVGTQQGQQQGQAIVVTQPPSNTHPGEKNYAVPGSIPSL